MVLKVDRPTIHVGLLATVHVDVNTKKQELTRINLNTIMYLTIQVDFTDKVASLYVPYLQETICFTALKNRKGNSSFQKEHFTDLHI